MGGKGHGRSLSLAAEYGHDCAEYAGLLLLISVDVYRSSRRVAANSGRRPVASVRRLRQNAVFRLRRKEATWRSRCRIAGSAT